jgi:hypothetical protein
METTALSSTASVLDSPSGRLECSYKNNPAFIDMLVGTADSLLGLKAGLFFAVAP